MGAKTKVAKSQLEGMAKVLEAFFKESPAKTVSEIAEHVGKTGGDDVVDAIRKAGGKADADAMEKALAKAKGKGHKALQDVATEFGEGLERQARDSIKEAAKKDSRPPGGGSWLQRSLDQQGKKFVDATRDAKTGKLIEDNSKWHGHHVPFKNYGPAKLRERANDMHLLMMKNGIDPICGEEVLMVARNKGHSIPAQEAILDALEAGWAKGGKQGLLDALEQAKRGFWPPYPMLGPK